MNRIWDNSDFSKCIDIHCHILPDIDDGAQSFEASVEMLESAKNNGVDAVVATPHVRSGNFDFGFAYEQYSELKKYAEEAGIELFQGFEVNCEALIDFAFKDLSRMCFQGSDKFLLEFKNFSLPPNWQLVIKKLRSEGFKVIVAHPERYDFVQRDISIAEKMADMGCELQCDAFPFDLGRFDRQRRTAYKLLDGGLVSWIATDAHAPGNFDGYKEVMEDFRTDLIRCKIEFGGN